MCPRGRSPAWAEWAQEEGLKCIQLQVILCSQGRSGCPQAVPLPSPYSVSRNQGSRWNWTQVLLCEWSKGFWPVRDIWGPGGHSVQGCRMTVMGSTADVPLETGAESWGKRRPVLVIVLKILRVKTQVSFILTWFWWSEFELLYPPTLSWEAQLCRLVVVSLFRFWGYTWWCPGLIPGFALKDHSWWGSDHI